MSNSTQSCEMLDLFIFKGPDFEQTRKLSFCTHAKALNTHQYIPKLSQHDARLFRAWIKAGLLRHATHCSDADHFAHVTNWFLIRLLARGHAQHELSRIYGEVMYGCRTRILNPVPTQPADPDTPDDLRLFLKLRYDSVASDVPFARIMREQITDLHGQVPARCSTEPAYLHSLARVVSMVCWKSGKSHGSGLFTG